MSKNSSSGATRRGSSIPSVSRTPERNKLERKINEYIGDLSSKALDWTKRITALKSLRHLSARPEICNAALEPKQFQELTLKLALAFSVQLTDGRSAIVKECCETISSWGASFDHSFAGAIEILLPALLDLNLVNIKVIAKSADQCLHNLVDSCTFNFTRIADEAQHSQSAVQRARCTVYVEKMVEHWPQESLQKYSEVLVKVATSSVHDAGEDGRKAGRKLLITLTTRWPDMLDKLSNIPDKSARNIICKEYADSDLAKAIVAADPPSGLLSPRAGLSRRRDSTTKKSRRHSLDSKPVSKLLSPRSLKETGSVGKKDTNESRRSLLRRPSKVPTPKSQHEAGPTPKNQIEAGTTTTKESPSDIPPRTRELLEWTLKKEKEEESGISAPKTEPNFDRIGRRESNSSLRAPRRLSFSSQSSRPRVRGRHEQTPQGARAGLISSSKDLEEAKQRKLEQRRSEMKSPTIRELLPVVEAASEAVHTEAVASPGSENQQESPSKDKIKSKRVVTASKRSPSQDIAKKEVQPQDQEYQEPDLSWIDMLAAEFGMGGTMGVKTSQGSNSKLLVDPDETPRDTVVAHLQVSAAKQNSSPFADKPDLDEHKVSFEKVPKQLVSVQVNDLELLEEGNQAGPEAPSPPRADGSEACTVENEAHISKADYYQQRVKEMYRRHDPSTFKRTDSELEDIHGDDIGSLYGLRGQDTVDMSNGSLSGSEGSSWQQESAPGSGFAYEHLEPAREAQTSASPQTSAGRSNGHTRATMETNLPPLRPSLSPKSMPVVGAEGKMSYMKLRLSTSSFSPPTSPTHSTQNTPQQRQDTPSDLRGQTGKRDNRADVLRTPGGQRVHGREVPAAEAPAVSPLVHALRRLRLNSPSPTAVTRPSAPASSSKKESEGQWEQGIALARRPMKSISREQLHANGICSQKPKSPLLARGSVVVLILGVGLYLISILLGNDFIWPELLSSLGSAKLRVMEEQRTKAFAQLQSNLIESTMEASGWRSQWEEAQGMVTSLEEKISLSQSAARELAAENMKLQMSYDDLYIEHSQLEHDLKKTVDEKNKLQKELGDLSAHIERAEREIAFLEESLRAAREVETEKIIANDAESAVVETSHTEMTAIDEASGAAETTTTPNETERGIQKPKPVDTIREQDASEDDSDGAIPSIPLIWEQIHHHIDSFSDPELCSSADASQAAARAAEVAGVQAVTTLLDHLPGEQAMAAAEELARALVAMEMCRVADAEILRDMRSQTMQRNPSVAYPAGGKAKAAAPTTRVASTGESRPGVIVVALAVAALTFSWLSGMKPHALFMRTGPKQPAPWVATSNGVDRPETTSIASPYTARHVLSGSTPGRHAGRSSARKPRVSARRVVDVYGEMYSDRLAKPTYRKAEAQPLERKEETSREGGFTFGRSNFSAFSPFRRK